MAAGSLAFALATAAVPLAAGSAVAEKPQPVIGAYGGNCGSPLEAQPEEHVAWFDLSSNKGRWIFVEAQYAVGGATWASYLPVTPTRVETATTFTMRTSGMGAGESSDFRLRIMDRKGGELTDWTEKLDVDC